MLRAAEMAAPGLAAAAFEAGLLQLRFPKTAVRPNVLETAACIVHRATSDKRVKGGAMQREYFRNH